MATPGVRAAGVTLFYRQLQIHKMQITFTAGNFGDNFCKFVTIIISIKFEMKLLFYPKTRKLLFATKKELKTNDTHITVSAEALFSN